MEKLPKFLVRLAVIFTAVYFTIIYTLAWFGIEFLNDAYIILFEACVCSFISVQGKYHCKYIKYTAWDLTACDTIARIDNAYDLLSVDLAMILSSLLLFFAWFTPLVLALHHYYKVRKLKRRYNDI